MDQATLASIANRNGRASRISGAPTLTADATVDTLIAWFQWNDPNGAWRECTDGECSECPRCQPMTGADAWTVLGDMLQDETA